MTKKPVPPQRVIVSLTDIFIALYWANEGRARLKRTAWIEPSILPKRVLEGAPWLNVHVRSVANKPHEGRQTAQLSANVVKQLVDEFAKAEERIYFHANPANKPTYVYDLHEAELAQVDYLRVGKRLRKVLQPRRLTKSEKLDLKASSL